jgi:hypothetical protein
MKNSDVNYKIQLHNNNYSRSPLYRAISLLNINNAITKLINKHTEANNFLAEEQKRCKKEPTEYKQQPRIDGVREKQA